MNERITALAVLSTETVPLYYGPAGMSHTKKFNREKFAESIIRECAGLYFRHLVPGITQEQDVDIGVAIKQHFGIV